MIPIVRAFCDPRTHTIIAVTAAQMAKTEMLLNIIGHRFDDGPLCPVLYIGPTQKHTTTVAGDRFAKLLETTPTLWNKLAKGQKNKLTEKWISGVRLGFGWAGSPTELSSHPAGLVVVDERDRCGTSSGNEGDPFVLAEARTETYPGSKIGAFSTPTIAGASPVWALWETGTMEMWAWPCPHCGVFFVPKLELLKWPEGSSPKRARRECYVQCPECGSRIDDSHRPKMNNRGVFLPHKLDGGDPIRMDTIEDYSVRSFWVSGLASPWRSFGRAAERLVIAYRSNDAEQQQAVINTSFGELFVMVGDAPSWQRVMGLAFGYKRGELPDGVQRITAGVDVQKNGMFYVVRGWGHNMESWLLDDGFVAGETEFDSVWMLLARVLSRTYGPEALPIERCGIDSGYRPGDKHRRPEHQVYEWCRRNLNRWFPCKGFDKLDRPLMQTKLERYGNLRLIKIDTDTAKSWVHGRIRWPEGQSGAFHVHSDVHEDYAKQLCAEELVIKPSGQRLWLTRNRRNHFLDCEVIAKAMASSLHYEALPETVDRKSPATIVARDDSAPFVPDYGDFV